MSAPRLHADFNGLFGDLLCLAHSDTCKDEYGNDVALSSGMQVTVFDADADEDGNPADIMANGTVEPSPDWLQCRGSRWALRLDAQGIYWQPSKAKP